MVTIAAEPPVKQYSVWDGPYLYFHVYERGDQPNTWVPANITDWEGVITMTPRGAGVGVQNAPLSIIAPQDGVFGYQVPGGRMPTDPLPQATIPGSFYQAMTLDVSVTVRTHPQDGSAQETLRLSPVVIVVQD
jgi:hypothetical protein